jgi:hypothetical protein
MEDKKYYSLRKEMISDEQQMSFENLKKTFLIAYNSLKVGLYFQKYLEETVSRQGHPISVENKIFLKLRKDSLYPIEEYLPNYTEEDLFDIIEFLHDNCSKGLDPGYLTNETGWNYYGCTKFDDIEGQKHYIELLNPILQEYKHGFEISGSGHILNLPENGLSNLLEAIIPTDDTENIKNRIDSAILKFRRSKSTHDERFAAIRELADVLEFIRPSIKEHLMNDDEKALFNIVNNFGIRHHNTKQKTDYDKPIWYSWIFYCCLATLHAVLRLAEKKENSI